MQEIEVPKATETSEFWVTAVVNVVTAIVAILSIRGLVSAEESDLWVALAEAVVVAAAPIIIGWTTSSYVTSRALLRTTVAQSNATIKAATLR